VGGGLAVFLRVHVRVMACHANGGPTEACLFLRLRDDRVEFRGMEVSERVQVNVGGNSGELADRCKGVAHGVWVGGNVASGLVGKSEGVGFKVDSARISKILLCDVKGSELSCRCAIDGKASNAGMRLWLFNDGPTFGGHDALVDGESVGVEVDIRPSESACFATTHSGCGDDSQIGGEVGVVLRGGPEKASHLFSARSSDGNRVAELPRWKLAAGQGVGKCVAAPPLRQPTGSV